MKVRRFGLIVSTMALSALVGLGSVATGVAEAQENFYEGKTLSVVIRSTPGGGYDAYGRLIARHIGKYIPGNPEVIAVNRPGAGGLVAANYMYEQAPSDGTEILIPARELPLAERTGADGVRYKTLEMPAIGSASSSTRVWITNEGSQVKSLQDLNEFAERNGRNFRFGVSGQGAGSWQMVVLLKEAGYPVDIVTGYEGTAEQNLAMLRGEVDGSSNTYDSVQDQIRDEGFVVFAKLGNHPDLADMQDVREGLIGDQRALAAVLSAPLIAGRPFVTAPGTPEDRVEILREAFRQALQDPQLLAEAEQAGRAIGHTSPEEMTELYEEILNAPDSVIQQMMAE